MGNTLGAKYVGHWGRSTLRATLIGVSTLPMVHLYYNIGVWDKAAAKWVNVGARRALEVEKVLSVFLRYGRQLGKWVCVGEPHVVVRRCFVFPNILHCRMPIGRLQMAFLESHIGEPPKTEH